MIPHEDNVDVVSPSSISVIGGGEFCSLMKIIYNVDVITRFNSGHRGWRVVSLFSILVIDDGGF